MYMMNNFQTSMQTLLTAAGDLGLSTEVNANVYKHVFIIMHQIHISRLSIKKGISKHHKKYDVVWRETILIT